jgi:hypothetical protein
MEKRHPHFGATYKIVPRPDATFAVEVAIPGSALVNITGFATEKLANAWVASHAAEIATGTEARLKLQSGNEGG